MPISNAVKKYLFAYLLMASILCVSSKAFCAGDESGHHDHGNAHDGKSCESYLLKDLPTNYIIASGNDGKLIPTYEEMVEIIFGKDGVARKLGMRIPNHQIEFVSGTEMALISATGGHYPIGHWIDGSEMANARGGSPYEFVTPGMPNCGTCRSFYLNSTPPEHQFFVLAHVAGHNDFSEHSMYWADRAADPMAASQELYDLMEKLYREINHDEVAQWYQFLRSLTSAQDFARGTFTDPKDLGPDKFDAKISAIHPRRPTPNVLQAFVANLPATAPKWKRDVAELYEKMVRMYTYVVPTKGMNEGYASIMMELIAQHLPESWQTDQRILDYAEIMSPVLGWSAARIGNPYWIGREAWRNLRRRFHERKDFRDLSFLERDQKFIAYAHTLIDQMNDYDFYRMALDERWVREHKLALYRKANFDEIDRNIPPPKSEVPLEQKIVLSTGKRVIDFLARMTSDQTLKHARIFVDNFHAFGRNVVSLRQDTSNGIPLLRYMAAETLFVLAQMQERAVSLRTLGATTWTKVQRAEGLKTFPIRIEVEPNGKVQVFNVVETEGKPEVTETLNEDITLDLQNKIRAFQEESTYAVDGKLTDRQREIFMPALISEMVNGATDPAMGFLSHTPTAARAILEYANFLEARMAEALRRALSGKSPVKIGGNFVRIPVLPVVPEFRLDLGFANAMRKLLPSPAVDHQFIPSPMRLPAFEANAINPDDAGNISEGDFVPGDHIWGPNEDAQRQMRPGEGDDGDSEPGDPGDLEGDNHGPGPGKDSREIDIDIDTWGKYLAEIELPNLQPKGSFDQVPDFAREGGVHRSSGNVLWERMIPQVLALGKIAVAQQGKNPRKVNTRTIMREGLRRIQPADYIVSSREPDPNPDMTAVLVEVMDLTGSMTGKPQELEKKFFKQVEAMLRAKYKHVIARRVGYDDTAEEYPGDTIFKAFKGGGNTDSSGYDLAGKILDEYNPKETNFYVIGSGDAGSSDGVATVNKMAELYERTQYMGFVYVDISKRGPSAAWGDMLPAITTFGQDKEWFGQATLTDDGSVLPAISTFFKKKD